MRQKIKPGHVLVEVDQGVEGPSLSIGDNDTGERVAGPKPWGGGRTIYCFQVSAMDLIRLAKEYGGAEPSALSTQIAKCAEAMHQWPDDWKRNAGVPKCANCLDSGNGAPSAPVGRDERAAFQSGDTVRKKSGSEWEGRVVGTYSTDLTPEGYCVESSTHAGSVQIYPAAALVRKPSVAPDDDQPCDLATWKRRAIEAESKLRTYDPQIVEMGERAMKTLLADPKPDEVVLMKCKLCDQLQADITARDEELDRVLTVITTARQKACLPRDIETLLDSAIACRNS